MTFNFNTTIPDIDIWIENNLKLERDLTELTTQNVSEDIVNTYIEDMIQALRPVKSIDCIGWLFLMVDEPSSLMCADERVQFVYIPTYLAATIMMTAVNRYESIAQNGRVLWALKSVLDATLGRKFRGSGCEDNEGILIALRIFAAGDTVEFINKFPTINERFVTGFKNILNFVETEICTGKTTGAWGVDLSEEGKEVLELYKNLQ